MARSHETSVLIVGAGPVGLMLALCLRRAGIDTMIIDQAHGTATHSYACVLHPETLALLEGLGLLEAMVREGVRVPHVTFYEGHERRGALQFTAGASGVPYALAIPQSILEEVLVEQLQLQGAMTVRWNHRLTELVPEADGVSARVDQLGETCKGYIVPEWEWVVEKTHSVRASFIVGADGPQSHVRQFLGIESTRCGTPERLMVFEFPAGGQSSLEATMVLDEGKTHVFWPLPEGRGRWAFQLPTREGKVEFPGKETFPFRVREFVTDEQHKAQLLQHIQAQAPWFTTPIDDVDWSAEVQFSCQHVSSFGRGRCWLAGDAAHQASAAGVQSMNAGFREAADLARCFSQILKEGAAMSVLESYDAEQLARSRAMLGLVDLPQPGPAPLPWVQRHLRQLVACVPSTGPHRHAVFRHWGYA